MAFEPQPPPYILIPTQSDGSSTYDRIRTRAQGFLSLQVPVQDSGISPRGTDHQHFSISASWSCRGSIPGKTRLRDLGDLFFYAAPTSWTERYSSFGRPTILGLQSPSPQLTHWVKVLGWKKQNKKTRGWYLSPVPCS